MRGEPARSSRLNRANPMKTSGMHIVVAGGGIGGLSAAISLARSGARVTVLEKRASPTEDGAGIQIGPNGTRVLRELGVADRLEWLVSRPEALIVHDGLNTRELARLPLGSWIGERHGSPYWVAHRADLHRALRDVAEADDRIAIEFGACADGVRSKNDHAEVLSGEKVVAGGDLAVVADGLHSQLRRLIAGPLKPRFTGKTAARAVLDRSAVPPGLDQRCVNIWLAPFGHIVCYAVRGGDELAIVVIRNGQDAGEGWGADVSKADVSASVAGFAEPARMLIDAAHVWRLWSLQEMPAVQRWSSGRMALLGDAAHPVLPFLAQGAVLAIEDAAVLARSLEAAISVEDGLRDYEAKRMPRTRQVQAASKRNGQIYHMAGAAAVARNVVMGLAPAQRLMAQYDWLYGWTADS